MTGIVRVGDRFAGNMRAKNPSNHNNYEVVAISGVWVDGGTSLTTDDGKGIVLAYCGIGEYICPFHGVLEYVLAMGSPSSVSESGIPLHLIGDSVLSMESEHTIIDVVTTTGSSNTTVV